MSLVNTHGNARTQVLVDVVVVGDGVEINCGDEKCAL
jgi:hypothetical protein